jgi:hypothetical protein
MSIEIARVDDGVALHWLGSRVVASVSSSTRVMSIEIARCGCKARAVVVVVVVVVVDVGE